MSNRIAVVGSNMVDLITYVTRMPGRGETIEAPRFEMGNGGKGANQAVAAARLGSEVLMVSKVGDDVFGQNTIRNFQNNGVDTRHVDVVPGVSSGVAPIFVEPSGENSILIIKGANGHLAPSDVDAAANDLLGCDLILLQLEVPLETVYHTIAFAGRHGKPVLLNPAPATPELNLAKLGDVTFFTPNRSELALLSGLPTETMAEIETAARKLLSAGIRRRNCHIGERWRVAGDEDRSKARPGGAGKAIRYDRGGRCVHRQLLALLRFKRRYRRRAALGSSLRGALCHASWNAEILRGCGNVSRVLRRP